MFSQIQIAVFSRFFLWMFAVLLGLFFILTPQKSSMTSNSHSRLEDINQDDSKLSVTPPNHTFSNRDKKEFEIDVTGMASDKKLVVKNEADIDSYLTVTSSPIANSKLKFVVSPKGKGGKIKLQVSYDGKSAEIPLIFGGDVKVTDKGESLSLVVKREKELSVTLDDSALPKGAATPPGEAKGYEINNDTPGKLKVNALDLSAEPLTVTIKGFDFVLFPKDKITIKDELINILIFDKTQNIKRLATLGAGADAKKASVSLNLLQRDDRKYQILGRFASGKPDEKISWFGLPDSNPTHFSITAEIVDGTIPVKGVSLGSDVMTFHIPNKSPDNLENQLFEKLEITFTVGSSSHSISLNTLQTGNLLFPNGRVVVSGALIENNTNQPVGGAIKFNLKNDHHKVWVDLTTEATSAIVSWRKPTDQEIRKEYDSEIKAGDPLPSRPSEIEVVASAEPPANGAQPVTPNVIPIRLAEVKKFTKLNVKLNVMDERTASDLYGRVAADEYYVLLVRMVNDIKDERTGMPTGDSIIAYSGSMEIAVGLEKKFLSKSNSSFPRVITDKVVKEAVKHSESSLGDSVSKDDLNEPLQTLKSELEKAESELNTALKLGTKTLNEYNKLADAYERNPSGDKEYKEAETARVAANVALDRVEVAWERVYIVKENLVRLEYATKARIRPEIGGPDTLIDDGKWHAVSRADFSRLVPDSEAIPRFQSFSTSRKIPELPRPVTKNNAGVPAISSTDEKIDPPCVGTITYRPLTFEMVVNTVDRRDDRSVRTKFFKLMDFIGTGTSFVTAIAVPGAGSDLPLGLEKYRNLLIPGLDRLFPSLREQNRQNIVAQTMKPLEEIPYGSDMTRVVFIPKKSMKGIIRAHETRISEICPFYFKIDVAIISSPQTIQQGQRTP